MCEGFIAMFNIISTFVLVSFISVFVYEIKAVQFMSVIIYLRQCYGCAWCWIAGEDRVSARWARGHKLKAKEREPDCEKEESLLCPISFSGGGVRGAQGNEREKGGDVSPEYCRSPVISSHPPAKLQIYAVQTHSLYAKPLANNPPAAAFAMGRHGLTCHRYAPVFHVSCSGCVS